MKLKTRIDTIKKRCLINSVTMCFCLFSMFVTMYIVRRLILPTEYFIHRISKGHLFYNTFEIVTSIQVIRHY